MEANLKIEIQNLIVEQIREFFENLKTKDREKLIETFDDELDKKAENVQNDIELKIFKDTEIAKKKDLEIVKLELLKEIEIVRKEIKELEGKFSSELEKSKGELKVYMFRWQFIFWASNIGIMFSLFKYFNN